MSTMNRIAIAFDEEREELILRLAEVAGILRSVKRTQKPAPVVCISQCRPKHWTRFGWQLWCTRCGTPAVAADVWHRRIVEALRSNAAASMSKAPDQQAA